MELQITDSSAVNPCFLYPSLRMSFQADELTKYVSGASLANAFWCNRVCEKI